MTSAPIVMERLAAAGDERTRAIYRRHGAGENQFGVRFSELAKLRKEIGTSQRLAAELWATGNMEARTLATMIADPRTITEAQLDAWVADHTYRGLAEACAQLASKTPYAPSRMHSWVNDEREYVAQTGWTVVALAASDIKQPDVTFEPWLEQIERQIATAPNWVRHAMNNALIAIGMRSDLLRQKAEAAARRIGKVEVDHGETGCVTPDAIAYIRRAVERKVRKAKA